MKNVLPYSFLTVVLLLFAVGCGSNDDINVKISETKHELIVTASYPEKDSKRVHKYLRSKLRMTDLPDLNFLEIKEYQTPDGEMNFHIKSRAGYLKIVLDRKENSYRSYKALKEIGQELGKLLTNP